MPEVDMAIHAAVLIEEKFKRSYDDVEPVPGANTETTEEQLVEEATLR